MKKTFTMTLDKKKVEVHFSITSTGYCTIEWVKDADKKEMTLVKRQACLVFDKIYDIVNQIE